MRPLFTTLTKTVPSFFARAKRVRELPDAKISLQDPDQKQATTAIKTESYAQLRSNLHNLGWQAMSFDKLCSLPEETIKAIEIQIKKDKFNVDDNQFYQFRAQTFVDTEVALNPYYQRLYALLLNKHEDYDRIQHPRVPKPKYLHEIYINDLRHDKVLNALITFFINNLEFPDKLQAIVEPGLVKKLLTIRRELMIQGVKFKRLGEVKQSKKEERKLLREKKWLAEAREGKNEEEEEKLLFVQNEEEQEQQFLDEGEEERRLNNRIREIMKQVQTYKNRVQIQQVVNYEYEFWVDVKHNRKKNGVQQDHIIEQRQIDNPNTSLLLANKYPKVRVKYIVRKDKRKDYAMHFCTKADLLVKVNGHIRRVKVEWNGPANKQSPDTSADYKIIDYEFLMNGNPTIRSVFEF